MSFVGASGAKRLTRGRMALSIAVCAIIAAVCCVLAPLVGSAVAHGGWRLELLDIGAILSGDDPENAEIFLHWRLPRVLAGMIVGAGLAAAGCTFQAVLRNPLAGPFTLGISSGASLAAVIAIRFGMDATFLGNTATSIAALIGSAITVYVVWTLGKVGRSLPPATLILAGITIAMFCSAGTMLVQYTADFAEVARMVRWMMGGLDWTRYEPLSKSAVPIVAGVLILLWLARDLNALSAGDDAAASVGVNPGKTQTIAFVVSALVVGAAIAIAGPIGFVGLIVPHALRAVVGPDHRVLLPTSMLIGGSLLVVCDTLARIAEEIPVGVVTALLGGPFFLYILVREKSRGRIWGG